MKWLILRYFWRKLDNIIIRICVKITLFLVDICMNHIQFLLENKVIFYCIYIK